MKEFLRKRGLDVRQARRMVQDMSEWKGLERGECFGCNPRDEPQPLMKFPSYMKPLSGSMFVDEPAT